MHISQILKKNTADFCHPEDGRLSVSTYDLHNIKTPQDYHQVKVNKISGILMLRTRTHTWVVSKRRTCSYKHKL